MPEYAFDLSQIKDEAGKKTFRDFWRYNGLLPALTNAHEFEPIRVNYTQMKAVINEGGAYRQVLLDFASVLNINDNSKRYQDALADMFYKSPTLQKYVNYVKEITELMLHMDEDDGRQWYIVWYEILDN